MSNQHITPDVKLASLTVEYAAELRHSTFAENYDGPWEPAFSFYVHVSDSGDQLEALERAWAWLNRGSGKENRALLEGRRSMSVGDRVTVRMDGEESRWRCVSVGWERLDG